MGFARTSFLYLAVSQMTSLAEAKAVVKEIAEKKGYIHPSILAELSDSSRSSLERSVGSLRELAAQSVSTYGSSNQMLQA